MLPNLLLFVSCFVHHCLYFFFLSLYCLSFFFWFTASYYPFGVFSWNNDFLLALKIIDWVHIVMSLPSIFKMDELHFYFSNTISSQKRCSIRLDLCCRGFMFYLRYLYSFTYTDVQHNFHIRWYSCRLTVTRLVLYVEQELLNLPGDLSSPRF